jgi:KamA family protein
VLPDAGELDDWGSLDASNETGYTVVPGLEHKYGNTALLLVNNVCGAYCRFCFRKRLFMDGNHEVVKDVSDGIAYIRAHDEIDNVLLTGGDPLLLSTARLEVILRSLRSIPHVKVVRIGSKMPAFNPYRILDDPELVEMLGRYSEKEKKIYIMCHFNHPREITEEARRAIALLQAAGLVLLNQTPLLRGINDDPELLAELFNRLSYMGVQPYYLFQCRPTKGNRIYSLTLEESLDIFEKAQNSCSGLARSARLVISHSTGKMEIVGKNHEHIFLRYHSTPDLGNGTGIIALKRNPDACWPDELDPVEEYAAADYWPAKENSPQSTRGM